MDSNLKSHNPWQIQLHIGLDSRTLPYCVEYCIIESVSRALRAEQSFFFFFFFGGRKNQLTRLRLKREVIITNVESMCINIKIDLLLFVLKLSLFYDKFPNKKLVYSGLP